MAGGIIKFDSKGYNLTISLRSIDPILNAELLERPDIKENGPRTYQLFVSVRSEGQELPLYTEMWPYIKSILVEV